MSTQLGASANSGPSISHAKLISGIMFSSTRQGSAKNLVWGCPGNLEPVPIVDLAFPTPNKYPVLCLVGLGQAELKLVWG